MENFRKSRDCLFLSQNLHVRCIIPVKIKVIIAIQCPSICADGGTHTNELTWWGGVILSHPDNNLIIQMMIFSSKNLQSVYKHHTVFTIHQNKIYT